MIVDSINRTDLDLRKSLFGNIVLSGGSTLCTGKSDSFLHQHTLVGRRSYSG
jgi:centractin